MDTMRLRVKYSPDGGFEFEAEGPIDRVEDQSRAWRKIVEGMPRLAARSDGPGQGHGRADGDHHQGLFNHEGDLVVLKSLPTGENEFGEALLLTMYGYRLVIGTTDVLVTKLKASLKQAGLPDKSVGGAAHKYIGSLLQKTGKRIGSRYTLTNRGVTEAKKLADRLVSQMT